MTPETRRHVATIPAEGLADYFRTSVPPDIGWMYEVAPQGDGTVDIWLVVRE